MYRHLCALAAKYRTEEATAAAGSGGQEMVRAAPGPALCVCGGRSEDTCSSLSATGSSVTRSPTAGRRRGAMHLKKEPGEGPTGGRFPTPCPGPVSVCADGSGG